MTWKEFKDAVESQGVKDADEIGYIDTYPDAGVAVEFRNDGIKDTRVFDVTEV